MASARRNLNFLRSVDAKRLTGYGWAYTLTLKTCPPTPKDWQRLVNLLLKRVARSPGYIRYHWVMEMQRRACPHLHLTVWWEGLHRHLEKDWVEIAAAYEPSPKAQQAKPLDLQKDDGLGWFQYLSKHASRGHAHYQRQQAAMPKEWASCSRVWAKGGEWPIVDPGLIILEREQFYRLRRIVKGLTISEARQAKQWKRLRWARRTLKTGDQRTSSVRPVSEWMDGERQRRLMDALFRDV